MKTKFAFILVDNFFLISATAIFGTSTKYSLFGPCHINELLVRMTYRRHNSHVMQVSYFWFVFFFCLYFYNNNTVHGISSNVFGFNFKLQSGNT